MALRPYEDYFALQLQFAQRYAAVAGVPLHASVSHCTNLRRRLGWMGPGGEAAWQALLAPLERGRAPAEWLQDVLDAHATRPAGGAEAAAPAFGCFRFDAPDAQGVVRIHFMPPAGGACSPLAKAQVDERREELRAMFAHIGRCHGTATRVRGVSWLYQREAYRRLFPPAYVQACRPAAWVHLTGSSTWGQVLDWRQRVRPEVRQAVLLRLPALAADAPWRVFPLQALVCEADIRCFGTGA